MKKALFLVVLLAAGAVLARYHVANQHYYPVTRLASSDGYTFHLVQNRVDTRGACGAVNDRFVAPLKEGCPQCRVVYARCERELQGIELQLLMGEPVPLYVVVAPGLRMAMQGPAAGLRRDCEHMAAAIVKTGVPTAACAYPGVMRRP
jgi:hypothetical protein